MIFCDIYGQQSPGQQLTAILTDDTSFFSVGSANSDVILAINFDTNKELGNQSSSVYTTKTFMETGTWCQAGWSSSAVFRNYVCTKPNGSYCKTILK